MISHNKRKGKTMIEKYKIINTDESNCKLGQKTFTSIEEAEQFLFKEGYLLLRDNERTIWVTLNISNDKIYFKPFEIVKVNVHTPQEISQMIMAEIMNSKFISHISGCHNHMNIVVNEQIFDIQVNEITIDS